MIRRRQKDSQLYSPRQETRRRTAHPPAPALLTTRGATTKRPVNLPRDGCALRLKSANFN
ncbi:hypothetical protein LINGRAHAP2_LOCUS8166 [Linum grandiflorum]